MSHHAYYNEHDRYAAQWLRNLIKAGAIAPGYVDERSIEDVTAYDLRGFTQHHFFAGIGVWSRALRQAGWGDDRRIWSMSCPCQSFSTAGKGLGFADERHLWPAAFHLITQLRPGGIIGEQVANKDAEPWLDLVQDDMEAVGYAFGAVACPASGFGAPHIRDRTYWCAVDTDRRVLVPVGDFPTLAHAASTGLQGSGSGGGARPGLEGRAVERGGAFGLLADAHGSPGGEGDQVFRGWPVGGDAQPWPGLGGECLPDWMAHAQGDWGRERPGQVPGPAGALQGAAPGQRDGDAAGAHGATGGLGHPHSLDTGWHAGASGGSQAGEGGRGRGDDAGAPGSALGMADAERDDSGREAQPSDHHGAQAHGPADWAGGRGGAPDARPGPTNGFWRDADWLQCRDGKWRATEPGASPLVVGAAQDMGYVRANWNAPAGPEGSGHRGGRLKGYGNAIVLPQAQMFIECIEDQFP